MSGEVLLIQDQATGIQAAVKCINKNNQQMRRKVAHPDTTRISASRRVNIDPNKENQIL